ncbi:hypothetical protein D3C86_1197930 [compost metagenome]
MAPGHPGRACLCAQHTAPALPGRHGQRPRDQPASRMQEGHPAGQVRERADVGQAGKPAVQAGQQPRRNQAGDHQDIRQGPARCFQRLRPAGTAIVQEAQHDQRTVGRQQCRFRPQKRRRAAEQGQACQHPAGFAPVFRGGRPQSGTTGGPPEQDHPDAHQQSHRHHAV